MRVNSEGVGSGAVIAAGQPRKGGILAVDPAPQGVARGHPARIITSEESFLALFRGTVRPRIGLDLPGGTALNIIITYCLRRGDGIGDLLWGNWLEQSIIALIRVRGPNPRVAICLELDLYRVGVRARVIVVRKAQGSLEVLDMVAKFVGDNVHLCKRGVVRTVVA